MTNTQVLDEATRRARRAFGHLQIVIAKPVSGQRHGDPGIYGPTDETERLIAAIRREYAAMMAQ